MSIVTLRSAIRRGVARTHDLGFGSLVAIVLASALLPFSGGHARLASWQEPAAFNNSGTRSNPWTVVRATRRLLPDEAVGTSMGPDVGPALGEATARWQTPRRVPDASPITLAPFIALGGSKYVALSRAPPPYPEA